MLCGKCKCGKGKGICCYMCKEECYNKRNCANAFKSADSALEFCRYRKTEKIKENSYINNVRAVREAMGMSQKKLAELSEMSQGDLASLELGRIEAYDRWKKRISKALGKNVEELFPKAI